MTPRALATIVIGICATMLAGCTLEGVPESNAPEEPVASRAVVSFAPDGTPTVKYDMITARQQQDEIAMFQERAQRAANGLGTAADALTIDGSCSSSDDWFYDQHAGSSPINEVCFSGTGTIDLSTVCRGTSCPGSVSTSNWAGAVRSYLTQGNNGHFNSLSGSGVCTNFPISTVQTNLDVGNGNYLTIGSACCTGTKKWCYCSLCEDFSFCGTSQSACTDWCNGGC